MTFEEWWGNGKLVKSAEGLARLGWNASEERFQEVLNLVGARTLEELKLHIQQLLVKEHLLQELEARLKVILRDGHGRFFTRAEDMRSLEELMR